MFPQETPDCGGNTSVSSPTASIQAFNLHLEILNEI